MNIKEKAIIMHLIRIAELPEEYDYDDEYYVK